ncbi:MAG TPA: Localization factor PodJS [Caulobacteraceae bacterium]|jgi:localization factor PodJL|nr:Localization factor PodJS [Caulobacteraceae bacterium]
MSSAGPWSVKGIDPKAREVAKDLARRSGMTLGEWLNQMIIDGGDLEPPPMEPEYRRRSALQAGAEAPLAYESDPSRRGYEPRAESELIRLTRALDAFSSRLEAAEHRSTLAISGIDQSVMGVLSRLDGMEREQGTVSGRFDGALDEVRGAQAKLADRMRQMEQDDGPRVEAMKALESALGRVAAQIYEGESRTRGALTEVRQDLSGIARRVDRLEAAPNTEVIESVVSRIAERLEQAEGRTAAAMSALEASFAGLDDRLKTAETRLGPEGDADTPERRFERLGAELAQRVEAQRAELTEQMRAAADGKLDRMEAALRDLSGQVESAERQSAQAIDRMGREVVKIAQSLGQRVTVAETRSAKAVEEVGGKMARIAEAMENRMRTADTAQAEALEKLGGEIGKIAERLAERIAASERRAATAIDEVGDQVARVTDKLNSRSDRSATELSERIRQSEERTAKLLEEARETLDRRLAETQRKTAVEAVVQAVETPAAAIADFDDGGFSADSFADQDGTDPFPDDPFAPEPTTEAHSAPAAFADLDEGDIEPPAPAADSFSDLAAESYAPQEYASHDYAPQPAPRTSTRELIEAARAAARQASAADGRGRRQRPAGAEMFTPSTPAPSIEAADAPRGLSAFLSKKKKKKETGTVLRTALLASVTAAFLSTSFVGYTLLSSGRSKETKTEPPHEAPPIAAAAAQTNTQSSDADLLAAALTSPPPVDASAMAATAATEDKIAAKPAAKAADAAPPALAGGPKPVAAAASVGDAKQLYSTAVRQIESGDATGVDPLRRAANLGYAPAQFYLAKLYETGASRVKKDPVEARRWTERAAASGDPKAMHNLGLYFFEGTGGVKNASDAAVWFRKAADAGLQDSQYNLARLYEQGYGVAQNPAEAYKWYLIAAAGGDAEARSGAERLRQQLTPETQQASQRSASAFRPQSTSLAAK